MDIRFDDFSGCILATSPDKTLYECATGWADIANGRPNRISTRFETASLGKVFIACGILQLIERGRLALDSRLGDCVDFELNAIDPDITIEQLLTHTSGIPDYFDEEEEEDYAALWHDFPNYRVRCSRDLIPLFNTKPMKFRPGERFCYNNGGYVVLGLIIEHITGMPFDKYLAENVFAPAGMTGTGYFQLDRMPGDCANAYLTDAQTGETYTNIFSIDCKGSGAGGAYCNVNDITAFWRALMGGRLLSMENVRQMVIPHGPQATDDDGYGYGIWLAQRKDGSTFYYVCGFDPGVSAVCSYDPADGHVIAMLANFECSIGDMRTQLETALAGQNR